MVTDKEFEEFMLETKTNMDTLYENQCNMAKAIRELSEQFNSTVENINKAFTQLVENLSKFVDETRNGITNTDVLVYKTSRTQEKMIEQLEELSSDVEKLSDVTTDIISKLEADW